MDMSNSPRPFSAGQGRTDETAAGVIQLDPAANAALEEAIKSARQGLKPASSQALPENFGLSTDTKKKGLQGRLLAQAATALLLIGTGWLASYMGTLASRDAIHRMEAETARNQEILTKLTDDLAALKSTMAAARDVEQTASTVSASDQAKAAERIAEKLDRLAIAVQGPAQKLSALEERIDRMENQILVSLNNLSAPKPAVTPIAATSAPLPEPDTAPPVKPARTEPVDGWVLREVYNGSALVESRNRGLYEVMPGNVIPGVGRVEAIERRGARWVVVTDKGFIGTYR